MPLREEKAFSYYLCVRDNRILDFHSLIVTAWRVLCAVCFTLIQPEKNHLFCFHSFCPLTFSRLWLFHIVARFSLQLPTFIFSEKTLDEKAGSLYET